MAACAPTYHFQNLVVWNQTEKHERVEIKVDGYDVYSGELGTIDGAPRIVFTQSLAYQDGTHTLFVVVPSRSFSKSVTFTVGKQPVNLHVVVNSEGVEVDVTYGYEAYQ